MRLRDRLSKLESVSTERDRVPAAWIVMEDDETQDQATERYEAEHGPIGDGFVIMWKPMTEGAPCHA